MAHPNLVRRFKADGLKVGHSIFEFDSPGMGLIIAAAGAEFVFLDMEHSGFGFGDVKRILVSLHGAGLACVVRPPSNAYHHIARALDVAADGLVMPMVASAQEAEHIVACMKYPPAGRRGVALGLAHDAYATGAPAVKMAAANRRTAFVALIETAEGIENVDAIAAVKGVDCLWIGHFDLSASLGISGQFENPIFTRAVERVRRAGAKHGKALARLVDDAASGAALYGKGFDVICYSGDVWVYQSALTDGIAALKQACERKGKGRR